MRLAARIMVSMAALACDGGGSGRESATRSHLAATRLADSVAGDTTAMAALPPALRAELDLRPHLSPAALADTTRAACRFIGAGLPSEERRRLWLRVPGDTTVVLFVRADRATGALRRELVRRPAEALQRGFIWDATTDVLLSVEWYAQVSRATRTSPIPRGSPAARALRGLGRRLLTLPCEDSPPPR